MPQKLSPKAAKAKAKRDLAAAKTPSRRQKKAENQRKRRKAAKKHGIKWQGDSRSDASNPDRVHFYTKVVSNSEKDTCKQFYSSNLGGNTKQWDIGKMQKLEKEKPGKIKKILGIT